jgi:hypothetical protein
VWAWGALNDASASAWVKSMKEATNIEGAIQSNVFDGTPHAVCEHVYSEFSHLVFVFVVSFAIFRSLISIL